MMMAYVDAHRDKYGAESICKVLQIAPSGYWRHAARKRDPELCSDRAKQDERQAPMVREVWDANLRVYGADKVWHQLNRQGEQIARCTVERLMKRLGGPVRYFVCETVLMNGWQ